MEINVPQVIFQIINIGIVFGAISFLLHKPVQKVLDDRKKKIEEGERAAEEAISERDEASTLKAKIHKEGEKEAAKIIDRAKKEANNEKRRIVKKAKDEAGIEVEEMKRNWGSEKDSLMGQLRVELVNAVIQVSEKVISQKLDSKSDRKLINSELDSVLKKI